MELLDSLRSHQLWKYDIERIFRAIETNENTSTIVERIQNYDSAETIAQWLREAKGDSEDPSLKDSSLSIVESSDHEKDNRSSSLFRWSSVTADKKTMDHLLTLYFAWIHPFYMLFDEQLFIQSYQQSSDTFCSPPLVNAICAMACYYHTAVDADAAEFELLSKGFSDAVRHKLDHKDESLLSVQVFALMFLVDCAQGKGLHGSKYLEVANSLMASLEYMGDNNYQRVWRITARGVHCLNIEWAQMTFQMSPIVNALPLGDSNGYDEEYPLHVDDKSGALYRISKDNVTETDWHSGHTAIVNQEKTKLLDIVRDVEVLLYNPGGSPISAQDMLILYSRFLVWRRDLPKVIDNTSNKHAQLLPHAISMLILYHTAVVQLLRPFLDLEGFPISLVHQVVWRHTQHGLFLLDEHYHSPEFYQHLSVIQIFAVLHLTDVVARFFPNVSGNHGSDGPAAVQLAIKFLAKSRSVFPVAGTFIELIYETAKDIIIPLPDHLEELLRCFTPAGRNVFWTTPLTPVPERHIHKQFKISI